MRSLELRLRVDSFGSDLCCLVSCYIHVTLVVPVSYRLMRQMTIIPVDSSLLTRFRFESGEHIKSELDVGSHDLLSEEAAGPSHSSSHKLILLRLQSYYTSLGS
jgi:hypothetical protein